VTADDTRAVIERYFELMMTGGDLTQVFADDIVWNLPLTNPMGTPIEGLDAVLEMLGAGVALYDPDDMHTEIHRLIADADGAAVRLTFHTRTAAGRPYEGRYQFQFAVRDGRIVEVWESPDTLYQEQMGVFAAYGT
jgi:ketosteroid isomerase-like protein